MLDQPLGFFDHHFGDLHVAGGGLVEGRRHDFAADRALHFGHLLGALIDQKHDQHYVRVVCGDRMRNVLQHHRLAGFRRGNQQSALTFADGRDDVDDAAGDVFLGLDVAFQDQRLVGKKRREIFEKDLAFRVFRRFPVDLVDLDQGEVTLAVLGRPDLAFDRVAGVKVEAADLRWRDVDVVGPRQVAGVGRAEKPESVRQHLQRSIAEDAFAFFRLVLEQRENEVVLAQAVRAVDLVGVGDFDEFGDGFGLEVGQVHRWTGGWGR